LASAALLALLALAIAQPGLAAVRAGTPGPDSLLGTARADTLLGKRGNDALSGRGGPDRLVGGPGEDTLVGGPGVDRMMGGGDDDRLTAVDGSVDRLNCGGGSSDAATVDAIDRVSPNCERVDRPVVRQSPAPKPAAGASISPPPAPAPAPEESEEPQPEEDEPEVEYEERPLAMFPHGHGWTGKNGTFGDVGSPLIVNGDRSFRITTTGDGTETIASSPALEPVDLTGSHVSVHAQVSFSSRLKAVKLRLASGDIETDYAEATVWQEALDPVILGSSFEFQSLPRDDFEVVGDVDWSQIDRAQIVLTDNQLGEATFYVAGIYAVPTAGRATISFAFDDGHQSVFTHGLKKLSSYRYPATAYMIADMVGDPGILSLEQLYKLRNQHRWEIAGHSMTLAGHNLPDGFDDLEPEALKAEMDELRGWLDEHGFSRTSFAYPKGAAGPQVREYVARDYCAGRVTARGPETLPTRDNYTIRGWSINGFETDAAEVEAAIDKAAAQGTWLVLTFHDIVGGEPALATEFEDDEFDAVVEHVQALQKQGDLRVRTVGDAVGRYCYR
jgi:peptidoglycan/xylan/chitin deacetylase (PgdA/CDA1 family)